MVPKAGFEPAHPHGALDPESSASASFATSALRKDYGPLIHERQGKR